MYFEGRRRDSGDVDEPTGFFDLIEIGTTNLDSECNQGFRITFTKGGEHSWNGHREECLGERWPTIRGDCIFQLRYGCAQS